MDPLLVYFCITMFPVLIQLDKHVLSTYTINILLLLLLLSSNYYHWSTAAIHLDIS